ncbi:MAG: MBL fold metallo-hydrolase [Geminicoccaceae bacterium]
MTNLTRREVIRRTAGATALGLAGALTSSRMLLAGTAKETGFFRYQIGDIRCTALYDGIWRKDHAEGFILNASVDDTRDALAKGGLAPDHVTIEFAQTLLEMGGRTVLIDPGTGGQWVPTAGSMLDHMTASGLHPRDIDTILISHFHPDHIFGLMEPETNAQVFPDSEIIVPAAEYDFWTDPQIFSKLPEGWRGLAQRIQATFPNWPNVSRVMHDIEVLPGIRSLATPGHTPGHTAYHISSGRSELIVAGDIAITPALFVANPGWHITFDADPELAETTRRQLFDRVVTDDIFIAGYHFGFPNVGRMVADGAGYALERLTT